MEFRRLTGRRAFIGAGSAELYCLTLLLALSAGGCDRRDPAGAQAGWTLLWSDEFNTPGAPDPEIWSHEVNCWGGGNDERQCYTDRLENSYVDEEGLLHIVAKEEGFAGPSIQDDDPGYPGPAVTRAYTSGRLRTKNKADWKYGRAEIRAKVPGGQGIWPAIWMLPTDWKYGGWPSSGEIDIVEAVNLGLGDFEGAGDLIHGTLHYGLPWPQWENHGRSYPMDVNPADDFHVYAIEWEADEIRWYVDGAHYQTQTSDGWYNYIWRGQETGFAVANPRAPFDQRFHLVLNVAVGGNWPGPPDTGWAADREMLIDYVRVYAINEGTVDFAVQVHRDAGAPNIQEYVVYDGGDKPVRVEVNGKLETVDHTLMPGSFAGAGVTVGSDPYADGAWEISFTHTGSLPADGFIGNVSLGSSTGLALDGGTGWTHNGELEFDLKVQSIAPQTRLSVKMDSGDSQANVVPIEVSVKKGWQHVAIKIADLIAHPVPGKKPMDLKVLKNVFVLESTGPAHVWVDNIGLQCAVNPKPEDGQTDNTCRLITSVPDQVSTAR